MSDIDDELKRRTEALLEPGDVELQGLIVHTRYDSSEESMLHRATIDVGEAIATHTETGDTYVYSGTDDPEFGLNQHQGLTIENDAFVWECQQLLREGTYDVVFYYEASADHDAILDALEADGYDVTGIEG
jgi:uncharacterized protein (DUF736 family)